MKSEIHKCDICGKEFKTHPIKRRHCITSPPDEGRWLNYGRQVFPVCYECYDNHFALSPEKISIMLQNIESDMMNLELKWNIENTKKGLMH